VAYSGSSTPRSGADSGGTLRLLSYLALGVVLMVSDHRGGVLSRVRQSATVVIEPVWWLASLPARAIAFTEAAISNQTRLSRENVALRQDLLKTQAKVERLRALADENQRLRELLGGTRGDRLAVQLASILDIDLDPIQQRIVLDVGSNQGVHPGQAVIDAGGVLGQVVTVTPTRATALLITDPDHAVPVLSVRSGLRLIAYGTGHSDSLHVPNIPLSGDLKIGDELITSGIGGRFPAGFPVGRVTTLSPDANHAFIEATLAPAARLDRSGDVLLVWNLVDTNEAIGPPTPEDLPTRRAIAAIALRDADAKTGHSQVPVVPPPALPPQAPAQPSPSRPAASQPASSQSAPSTPAQGKHR
jgi:rod shape-determining protein MreC